MKPVMTYESKYPAQDFEKKSFIFWLIVVMVNLEY